MHGIGTILLLIVSNIFMTFAWYGHLKIGGPRTWIMTVVISWAIAFFEYLFMIPANRIGYTAMSVAQLKILQEVLSLKNRKQGENRPSFRQPKRPRDHRG